MRVANFPFSVESIGQVHFFQTRPNDERYTRLEVTLRLSSEADHACDVVDGKKVTTPYPHAVFKMPGHHHSFHMDAEKQPDITRIAAENGFSERSFYRQWKKVSHLLRLNTSWNRK